MIKLLIIKGIVLRNLLGVVDYTKMYHVTNAVQDLLNQLKFIPEYILVINVLLVGIYVLKSYAKQPVNLELWWDIYITYFFHVAIRNYLFYDISNGYFNFAYSPMRYLVLLLICIVLTSVQDRIHIKHSYMLLLISVAINLILSSKDLLVTSFLLEALFILTVLWLLLDSSKSTIQGVIRYLIINALGGGLFLFASSSYLLVTGETAYSSANFSLFTDKIGIYCFFWSFLIKIAAFPFHFWNIDIINSFSNLLIIIYLQVISKFVMLLVYYKLFTSVLFQSIPGFLSYFFIGSGVFSILVGLASNPYQYRIKEFLSLSSLIHIAFIQIALGFNSFSVNTIALWYMLVYSLISCFLWYYVVENERIFVVAEFTSSNVHKQYFSLLLFLAAGYPPSPLFFLKLLVILGSFLWGLKVLAVFLVVCSALNYINYFRLVKVLVA